MRIACLTIEGFRGFDEFDLVPRSLRPVLEWFKSCLSPVERMTTESTEVQRSDVAYSWCQGKHEMSC